jgi:hypothetical protein
MSWASCYEATSEADAELVREFLESRGVRCRLQPMGSSMFPSMGFEVLVPADRLEDALALVDTGLAGADAAAAGPAWQCPQCGETVEGGLDACWSCGASRDDAPVPIERISPPPDDRPRVAVLQTFGDALRLVAAHPEILAAAIPLLVWDGISAALDLPEARTWRANVFQLPSYLVLGPIAGGLAIALANRPSRAGEAWTQSVRHVVRKLPSLIALAAILVAGTAVIAFAASLASGNVPLAPMVIFGIPPAVYLGIRLAFLQVSIVVDDVGLVGAIERSWALTGGSFWRMMGLLLLTGLVTAWTSWLPHPASVVVSSLLEPFGEVVLVLAHRQLAAPTGLGGTIAAPLSPLTVQPA